jgi:hypothetical protein
MPMLQPAVEWPLLQLARRMLTLQLSISISLLADRLDPRCEKRWAVAILWQGSAGAELHVEWAHGCANAAGALVLGFVLLHLLLVCLFAIMLLLQCLRTPLLSIHLHPLSHPAPSSATMLALLSFILFGGLLTWLLYHFLLSLPTVDLIADRNFVDGKTVWITGASSGIGKGRLPFTHGSRPIMLCAVHFTYFCFHSACAQYVTLFVLSCCSLPVCVQQWPNI